MIRISRQAEPEALTQERARRVANLRRAWLDAGIAANEPAAIAKFVEQYGDKLNVGYSVARQELLQLWARRCAYCSAPISKSDPIDHFRPRRPHSGERGYEHTGYWWLTWSWSNLLPSCTTCNGKKGNTFPVEGSDSRCGAKGSTTSERCSSIRPPTIRRNTSITSQS
ncbi:MAG: hypothetical protein HC927_08930 [Deltaproteobacteria bacterium]|nr:hypothetical protein [Deltaproteobacteria bacterium]